MSARQPEIRSSSSGVPKLGPAGQSWPVVTFDLARHTIREEREEREEGEEGEEGGGGCLRHRSSFLI